MAKIDETPDRTVSFRRGGFVVRPKAKKKLGFEEAWEKQEKKEKRRMKKAGF